MNFYLYHKLFFLYFHFSCLLMRNIKCVRFNAQQLIIVLIFFSRYSIIHFLSPHHYLLVLWIFKNSSSGSCSGVRNVGLALIYLRPGYRAATMHWVICIVGWLHKCASSLHLNVRNMHARPFVCQRRRVEAFRCSKIILFWFLVTMRLTNVDVDWWLRFWWCRLHSNEKNNKCCVINSTERLTNKLLL